MSKETFAGEPLDPYALKDEITRLRADLAAVTEERDRMLEALRPFAVGQKVIHGWYSNDIFPYVPDDHPVLSNKITVGDLRRARAAIEGVKEP